jgi:N-methylhydantoinase A
VDAAFAGLEAQAAGWFAEEQVPAARRDTRRVALMRYAGQGGELAVAWPGAMAGAAENFAAQHRALYGFDLPEGTVELVTLRLEATGRLGGSITATLPAGTGAVPYGSHAVHFAAGTREAALYDRAALGANDRFAGPAIVTQLDATTLVPPGWAARMHASGALVLSREETPA